MWALLVGGGILWVSAFDGGTVCARLVAPVRYQSVECSAEAVRLEAEEIAASSGTRRARRVVKDNRVLDRLEAFVAERGEPPTGKADDGEAPPLGKGLYSLRRRSKKKVPGLTETQLSRLRKVDPHLDSRATSSNDKILDRTDEFFARKGRLPLYRDSDGCVPHLGRALKDLRFRARHRANVTDSQLERLQRHDPDVLHRRRLTNDDILDRVEAFVGRSGALPLRTDDDGGKPPLGNALYNLRKRALRGSLSPEQMERLRRLELFRRNRSLDDDAVLDRMEAFAAERGFLPTWKDEDGAAPPLGTAVRRLRDRIRKSSSYNQTLSDRLGRVDAAFDRYRVGNDRILDRVEAFVNEMRAPPKGTDGDGAKPFLGTALIRLRRRARMGQRVTDQQLERLRRLDPRVDKIPPTTDHRRSASLFEEPA